MRAHLGAFFVTAALYAQPAATDQARLDKIRETATATLSRQPNYACLETVERDHEVNGMLEVADVLRLEVAIVSGKEMFGWPGSEKFEDLDVKSVVRGGLFDTGNYGIYPRMLFFGHAATFTYVGAAEVNHRPVLQYDFVVPKESSGFHVQRNNADVTVGFRGTVYVDSASLELARLVAIPLELPPELNLTEVTDRVDYGHVSLDGGSFLLPISSESVATGPTTLDRSLVQFSNCAHYSGESRLILDSSDPASQNASSSGHEVTLPEGSEMQLSINEIDLSTAAVGDSVKATLSSDIKRGKEILVPKGATAVGRIIKSSRYAKQYRLSLRFQQLDWKGGPARFNAELISVKSGKAELDPSHDLVVNRTTSKLTGLSLLWKVLP